MVPVSPVDKNSYSGELGRQLDVLICIHRLEDIMGSSPLVTNCCYNVSVLQRSNIHPESVSPRWKKST